VRFLTVKKNEFSGIVLPSNKKFGLIFCVVFAIAAGYLFNEGVPKVPLILTGLALTFFVISLTKPELLLPLNKLWMRFGHMLGMIVSPIVLGVIFFLMFSPIGLSLRLFGRDELKLKPKTVSSHWKLRSPIGARPNSFKQQF